MSGSIYDKLRENHDKSQNGKKRKFLRYRSRTSWVVGLIVILIVVFMDLFSTVIFYEILTDREARTRFKSVDAAVILIDESDQNIDSLGKEMERRIRFTTRLYEEEVIKHILCVGKAEQLDNIYGAEYLRQLFISSGVMPADVTAVTKPKDGHSNWIEARSYAEDQDWTRLLLIGSPLIKNRMMNNITRHPLNGLNVQYASYSINEVKDDLRLIDLYLHIHSEWLYSIINLLPKDIQNLAGEWNNDRSMEKIAKNK